VQPDALDGEGLEDQPAQSLGQLLGIVESAVGHQHRELVTPQPGQEVALAQRAAQPRADLAQQVIARVVAQAVVDLLEAVEVEQQQGRRTAGGGGVQHALGLLKQRPPVRQPRELVGPSLVPDLVESTYLAEGDGHPGQRREHAADGQPGRDRVEAAARVEPEHDQAGDVAGKRDGEHPPADARGGAGAGRRAHRVGVARVRRDRHQSDRGQPGQVQQPALDVDALRGQVQEDDVAGEVRHDGGAEQDQRAVAAYPEYRADGHQQTQQDDVGDRVGQAGGDGGRLALDQFQGRTQQQRDREGPGTERPHDAVEPHAGVEAEHAGADQTDQRHVQRQVVGQVEEVGDRGERLVRHRGDRQGVDEVADQAQQDRQGQGGPGHAVGA
jgi:hypothetical protein